MVSLGGDKPSLAGLKKKETGCVLTAAGSTTTRPYMQSTITSKQM